jgi:hypothetical protein
MEFLGVVLGVAAVASLGVRGASIRLRGDNTSSLRWALTERFRSVLCKRMSILFVSLGIEYDLTVDDSQHIAGEHNIMCDRLSRYREYSLSPYDLGFKDNQLISIELGTPLHSMVSFCDPTSGELSDDDFIAAWVDSLTLARAVVHPFGLINT